ncbi:MAG: DUF1648 domain-containing protein [Coprococcus sp.]|nr:DUF1648 domain-containing protein [Coprococcus sp.]
MKIEIKKTKMDIILEILCLTMLIGAAFYMLIRWHSIPDKIPMHYDWNGNIDRWGGKIELLILPVMTWLMYLFLSAVEHFPRVWNTGVSVTEDNQTRVYRTLKYLLKTMKVIVVFDFSLMTFFSLMQKDLPGWFTLFILVLVFGDLFYWIVKLVRIK